MESPIVTEENPTNEITPKMAFTGKVVKISLAGAAVDIGTGHPAVLHVSQILPPNENEPIRRVEDVLQIGQEIKVWVRKIREGRVELTMFEPLALDWREIKKGMTVKGTVTRLEKFGAFVDIGAERPGLVHISEMAHGYVRTPGDVVKEGDVIEAEVLEVNRRKKQIKLSMKALLPEPEPEPEPEKPAKQPVANAQSKEKPARRPKKANRKGHTNEDSGDLVNMVDAAPTEAEPTALEIAFREAMERAKGNKKSMEKSHKQKNSMSQDDVELLERTLGQKERS